MTVRRSRRWRNWWLRQLHSWHWISAALSLTAMLGFAITGITLNHAGSIGAVPIVKDGKAQLPPPLLRVLGAKHAADAPLPAPVAAYAAGAVGVDPGTHAADWSDGQAYVAMPGPGRDAWVSIDQATGAITAETTDRGWISWLNDLHKGRNTGPVWFWFIDLFAGACVLFTLTGLLLLQVHAKHRPLTWPTVGISLAVPLVLAHFFIR